MMSEVSYSRYKCIVMEILYYDYDGKLSEM